MNAVSMKRICILCAGLSVIGLLVFLVWWKPFLPTGISEMNLQVMFGLFFASFFFSFGALMLDAEIQAKTLVRLKKLEEVDADPPFPILTAAAESLDEAVPEKQEATAVS